MQSFDHGSQALLAMLVLGLFGGYQFGVRKCGPKPPPGAMEQRLELQRALDKTFSERLIWQCGHIDSVLYGLPDGDAIKRRMEKSNDQIKYLFSGIYSREVGNKLGELYVQDGTAFINYVQAVKAHNEELIKTAQDAWKIKDQQLIEFLVQTNPEFWKKETIDSMINNERQSLIEYVKMVQAKSWDEAVKSIDDAYAQALKLSKFLADGIIAQFADKFK